MKVAVWDTYVKRKNGSTMHFDILAPSELREEDKIHSFGKEYLNSKNEGGQPLSTKECRFCHIESATPEMVAIIDKQGYCIIEMENC